MTKKITTYEDLLQEQKRLNALLDAQKELIKVNFAELKAEMKPAVDVVSFLGKITTRDNKYYLLNTGAELLIDRIIKKGILSRSGWLSKLVFPFFIKNFSSHYLSKHVQDWSDMLARWIEQPSNGQAVKKEED